MKDPWLNHMRNLVEEHSETPPEGLWDDLEKTSFPAEEEETLVVPINSHVHEAARLQKKGFPLGANCCYCTFTFERGWRLLVLDESK